MKTTQPTHYGYLDDKVALGKRLARIEGQVRGITKMVEDERYCIDILTQLSAVQTALKAVGMQVLESHAGSCVVAALRSGDEQAAAVKTKELLAAVERFTRSRQ